MDIHDLGPCIPEITFESFKTALLPHVEESKLLEVFDALKSDGELSDEGWEGPDFEKAKREGVAKMQHSAQAEARQADTPAVHTVQEKQSTRATEDSLFEPLARKFNKILQHITNAAGKSSLITFSSTPTKPLKSEGTHGGYMADINALLSETTAVGPDAGKEQSECDIMMTGEFEREARDEGRDKNVSKLIGNINHLIGSDPTRRFMYGLTIEHTDTRFWFFSRSHVFVTEKLDLQTNVKDVVYFVMALGSASSKATLGFDPTVRRVSYGPNKTPRYRFKINGVEYEVIEVISNYKATFLLGRANRIFRVRRVENDKLVGPKLVLKDLWLPEGAKTELEILQDIEARINQVNPVKDLNTDDFSKHFVTIDECIIVKVPSMTNPDVLVDDNSTNFLRGQHLTGLNTQFRLKLTAPEYGSRHSRSIRDSLMSTPEGSFFSEQRARTRDLEGMAREYHKNKIHYRSLMPDAGKPLHEIRNFWTLLHCIRQILTALLFMFSAGYVHRDISTGNILVADVDGKVVYKLSDLEYAKDVNTSPTQPPDVKIGTPLFMAVEVENRAHLFMPRIRKRNASAAAKAPTSTPGPVPFRYNFLHDIESLLWVILYFVCRMQPKEDPVNETFTSVRLRKYDEFFSHSSQVVLARLLFLQGEPSCQQGLHQLTPEPMLGLFDLATIFAEGLSDEYTRVERTVTTGSVAKGFTTTGSVAKGFTTTLHREMQNVISTLEDRRNEWAGGMVDLCEKREKRKAEESETGGTSAKKGKYQ